MHVHRQQEEALTVQTGRLAYQRPDAPPRFAERGETVVLTRSGCPTIGRYGSEFAMTEIPAPVQRLLFPALTVAGRLLGKYRKYADAPEPLRP